MVTDPTDWLVERYRDAVDPAVSRRQWAAMMLTPHLDVCQSICAGRPVLARRLEEQMLRRAFRGEPIPAPDEYVTFTGAMLDAVAEGGPALK